MGHIFISYSRKDEVYVSKPNVQALENEGLNIWFDRRMSAGTKWHKDIEKNINICDAFVIVMSQNAADSEWVLSELLHAKEKKKPIFPLILDGELWLAVKDRNPVFVTDYSLPNERFFYDLAKFTSRKKSSLSPDVSQPQILFTKQNLFSWWGRILLGMLFGFIFFNLSFFEDGHFSSFSLFPLIIGGMTGFITYPHKFSLVTLAAGFLLIGFLIWYYAATSYGIMMALVSAIMVGIPAGAVVSRGLYLLKIIK